MNYSNPWEIRVVHHSSNNNTDYLEQWVRVEREDEGREIQISAGTSAIQKPPSLLCSRSSPYKTPVNRSLHMVESTTAFR